MKIAYERGLHELGDGLFAYLQPDGGWGWSNAGLVTAGGTSLLVDTLFDLNLTRDMLDAMAPLTDRNPIGQAFNTHGNGDHWFGNALLPDGIPIVASAGAIEDMRAAPAVAVNHLFNELDLGPEFEAFAERAMRRFDFASVTERLPTESFEGRHELRVGDRGVQLIELGPAHTQGDAIALRQQAGLSRPLEDYMAENLHFTTSGMFTYPPLICLLEVMGPDRVMFSVDYPYSSNSEGRDFVLGAPISAADREKLAFANARRLLGLDLSSR
jgi:Amidohydrolase/Metallo-beta-lactamase superfamily